MIDDGTAKLIAERSHQSRDRDTFALEVVVVDTGAFTCLAHLLQRGRALDENKLESRYFAISA